MQPHVDVPSVPKDHHHYRFTIDRTGAFPGWHAESPNVRVPAELVNVQIRSWDSGVRFGWIEGLIERPPEPSEAGA